MHYKAYIKSRSNGSKKFANMMYTTTNNKAKSNYQLPPRFEKLREANHQNHVKQIRRKTVQLINNLPNECLEILLKKVDLQQLVHLRLVSRRFQAVIESLFTSKRSLMLFDRSIDPDFSNRFVGQMNIRDLECSLKLRFDEQRDSTLLSEDLRLLLLRLFPKLDILVLNCYFDSHSAPVLFDLLRQNSQLSTLSLYLWPELITPEQVLCNVINSMPNLRQLDLWGCDTNRLFAPLKPTLLRLEHCSFYLDEILDGVRHLGRHCHRVSFGHCVTQWNFNRFSLINSQIAFNITHLSVFYLRDPMILGLICAEFSSLKWLRLSFNEYNSIHLSPDIIIELARLTQLRHLQLNHVFVDLRNHYIDQVPILKSIRSLSLTQLYIKYQPSCPNLCQVFSYIMPNLERIEASNHKQSILDSIEKNLGYFEQMRSHRLSLIPK